MFPKEDKNIPEPYKTADTEVSEMFTLIPRKGIPVEERKVLNAVVRQRLPELSDLAVANLMLLGHNLSRREFLLRLKGQRIQQIEAPFVVMARISGVYIHRPEPFLQARQAAIMCAPFTPVDRMVEVIDRFEHTPLGRDGRDVFEEVLSVHPEMARITDLFLERKGGSGGDWYTYWMGEIKEGAEKRRLERELQPPN